MLHFHEQCSAACRELRQQLHQCQAACCIDLKNRNLVAIDHDLRSFEERWTEMLGSAGEEIFCSKKFRRMHRIVTNNLRGELEIPSEIFIKAATALFFMKSLEDHELALIAATSPDTNHGLTWITLRRVAQDLLHSLAEAPPEMPATPLPAPIHEEDTERRMLRMFRRDQEQLERARRMDARLAAAASGRLKLSGRQRLLAIGRCLRSARIKLGISARETARRLGVDREEWEAWERGQNVIPAHQRAAVIRLLPEAGEFL